MPSILIVDDDAAIRRMLGRYLSRDGFTVAEAPDGQAALTYLGEAGPVDAILLDLRMPTMDGWAFRRAQRSNPAFAHIPVIVLSGADYDRFHELEADATFRKPTQMSELVPCVRKLIESRGTRAR